MKARNTRIGTEDHVRCGGRNTANVAGAITLLCAALVATVPAAVHAQEAGADTAARPSAARTARLETPSTLLRTYKISRDDVLSIAVVNRPEVSGTVQVDLDGSIDYHPYVGRIPVIGRTAAQVRDTIQAKLRKYYVRPQVVVTVSARAPKSVSMMGTAIGGSRGKVELREGWRLFDVLAASGGLPDDRWDFYKAELIRGSTLERIPIDLPKLYDNDPAANVELQPDDIIMIDRVEEAKTIVYATGQIAKTGPVPLPRDRSLDTVWQYIGPATANALLSKAHIERDGQIIPVDLRPLVTVGALPEKFTLLPGDKIVVPENKNYYYMLGAVGRPGLNVYPDDRKLMVGRHLVETVIPHQAAEDKKTLLVRTAPDGSTQKFELNVEEMIKTGDFSKDIELQPGDYVYVPFKKGSKNARAFNSLQAFGFAVGGIFGLRQLLNILGL